MNQTLPVRIITLAILACASPIVAWADLSENTILQTGSALNLDTGAVAGSGGDILWNGSTIARQGSATLRNLGVASATNFNGLPESYWVTAAGGASGTSIAANLLVTGDVFVAITNSGKVAKVMVIANTGGAITLQFTTFAVSAAPGVPVVAQILNNSSLTPVGMPNYGIAPSSIFVVQGSGLADPGNPVLQDSSAGLPLTFERSQHHGSRGRRNDASRAVLHQSRPTGRGFARSHSCRNWNPHSELSRHEQRSCAHPGSGERH